ncbi:hypothetical protein Tco_1367563 [Tanacetum coccineum]
MEGGKVLLFDIRVCFDLTGCISTGSPSLSIWGKFSNFMEADASVVGRVRNEDLRHVAKGTGATLGYLNDAKWTATTIHEDSWLHTHRGKIPCGRQGSNLDSNAKMWHLVADIMNDLSFITIGFIA